MAAATYGGLISPSRWDLRLDTAGLVSGNRRGYMLHYSINRAKLAEFRKAVAAFPDAEQQGAGLGKEPGRKRAARRSA